ncbi:MAG TPA: isoprenylcysteine carboxylmethyltransferase family protein [Pyrinomonadaceae bacterium]|nr:isoprenylcysteine carboxylmethyltransferase family protein [Pyrinomonadaceae bacterium]
MPKDNTWLQRWRVPLGFLTAVVFIILAQPRTLTLVIGSAVSLIGLIVRAWAAGHIRKNAALATTGPYAYTRNPLYLGSSLVGLGFTIGGGRWLLAAVFVLLFVGIYLPVMRVEASTLREIFGADYQRYAEEVPLFIPRITPYRRGRDIGFDRRLYLRYREYRAALGLLVAWGLLAFKAYYLK